MQCQPNSKHHKYEMHDPKPHDGLFLAPAGQLEMMVDRCHLEDSAVQKCSAENLDDDGDGLNIEQKAEEK